MSVPPLGQAFPDRDRGRPGAGVTQFISTQRNEQPVKPGLGCHARGRGVDREMDQHRQLPVAIEPGAGVDGRCRAAGVGLHERYLIGNLIAVEHVSVGVPRAVGG